MECSLTTLLWLSSIAILAPVEVCSRDGYGHCEYMCYHNSGACCPCPWIHPYKKRCICCLLFFNLCFVIAMCICVCILCFHRKTGMFVFVLQYGPSTSVQLRNVAVRSVEHQLVQVFKDQALHSRCLGGDCACVCVCVCEREREH